MNKRYLSVYQEIIDGNSSLQKKRDGYYKNTNNELVK